MRTSHLPPVQNLRLAPARNSNRRTPGAGLALSLSLLAAGPLAAGVAGERPGRDTLTFQRVEDHRNNTGRSGEGSAIQLADGRLLLMYSQFRDGTSDHSPADIVKRYSADGGRTWSPREVVFSRPPGSTNVMSASLLRLQDGRIGCVILVKWTQSTRCIPNWTTSADDGQTWAPLRPMTDETAYFVGNNDRLVQLRNGFLVFPYARHANTPARFEPNADCGILLSRDGGRTWAKTADENRFRKEWYVPPEPFRRDRVPPAIANRVDNRSDIFQESGVVELESGRLMMWVRSTAHVYLSYLDRLDGKWEPFRPAAGINVCLGPQTIKRLPGSPRLVMLYNDRGKLGYGEPGFSFRTPLSVAVSDDEGKTWKKLPPIESSDARNYCYFSLLFFDDRFLVSYYESADRIDLRDENGNVQLEFDGRPRRRNLATLKTCLGPVDFFRNQ